MANRTKVLLIITKANLGGAQRYVYDVARSLPKEEFDVCVAAGTQDWLHDVCTADNIRTVSLASLTRDISVFKDVRTFRELLLLYKKEKPDVVHLNSSKIGGMGALAARIAGIPRIIFTAHGWAFNEKRPYWQKAVIRFLAWLTMLLAHQTICVSRAVRNDVAELPFVRNKLAVIPLGVQPFPLLSRSEARAFLKKKNPALSEDAVWVGTIAELHTSKGIDIGIDAWKLLPPGTNAQWVVIGSGSEEPHLKVRADNVRNISFTGFVKDAKAYLSAFDVFLLPSRTEASGYVILEAGLAGLPVVATRVGGIPEIISDKATGLLVQKENDAALAAALLSLMQTPANGAKYGAALQRRVRDDFSLRAMIDATMLLYRPS